MGENEASSRNTVLEINAQISHSLTYRINMKFDMWQNIAMISTFKKKKVAISDSAMSILEFYDFRHEKLKYSHHKCRSKRTLKKQLFC